MELRLKFFLSSLSPLFLLLIIQNFSLTLFCKTIKKIPNKINWLINIKDAGNISITNIEIKASSFFWFLILLTLLISLIYTFQIINLLARTEKYKDQFKEEEFFSSRIKQITSLNNIDILNYVFTYLVPMLSLNINSYGSIAANFLLIYIVGYIYIKTNQIYQNPIFLLKNIYVYELNETYQIITDINRIHLLKNFDEVKKLKYDINEISEYVYIVLKKK